jgi:hypothetical protein
MAFSALLDDRERYPRPAGKCPLPRPMLHAGTRAIRPGLGANGTRLEVNARDPLTRFFDREIPDRRLNDREPA